MAQRSLDLIEAMRDIAEAAQPITGRGVGYKLFTRGLIDSMARSEMARVYRKLLKAREQGIIPWEWIVDETREFERTATWDDPEQYARCVATSYRRDFWNQQPVRVEVWSEKGTIRGVLQPVLDDLAVGFRVMHGFSCGTVVHNIAEDDDGRELIVLYVGDFDPSGMFMSEEDLPKRLAEYGGDHITVRRIALTRPQVRDLPSFPVADKKQRSALQVVHRRLRQALLGTGRDGPQRSARLRRAGDPPVDRAGRVGTLRSRQQGRAGIAANHSEELGAAMSRANSNMFQNTRPPGSEPEPEVLKAKAVRDVGRGQRPRRMHKPTIHFAGEEFGCSGGLHVSITIRGSADAVRFLTTLHARCRLAGFGWMVVGRARLRQLRAVRGRSVDPDGHSSGRSSTCSRTRAVS